MNENAKRWVEALRGGEYTQTTGRLRRGRKVFWRRDTFCVMGVLYDLYLKANGESWPRKSPTGPLPGAVLEWAGISSELERAVVAQNDEGYNFRDLASIIEAHLTREERRRKVQQAKVEQPAEDVERTVSDAIRKAQEFARRQAASKSL
jgi:hypothetical protein